MCSLKAIGSTALGGLVGGPAGALGGLASRLIGGGKKRDPRVQTPEYAGALAQGASRKQALRTSEVVRGRNAEAILYGSR